MVEKDTSAGHRSEASHRRLNLYLDEETYQRLAVLAETSAYSPSELVKRFIRLGMKLHEQQGREPQDGDFYIKDGDNFHRPYLI